MDINTIREDAAAQGAHRIKGVLFTMLGAFCFALAPVWVRSIEAYSSISIVFYRALIGSVPLILWVSRTSEMRRSADPSQLGWKQRLVLCCIGLSMCSTACFYYFAVLKTTVAKAVLLHYTAPIYVALLSPLLLKEKNTLLTWFAIGVGIFGTALIAEPAALLGAGRDEVSGIISAMLSGVCLAGVFLFGKFLSGQVPSLLRTMWGSLIVVLVLLPWGISVPAGHFWSNLPLLVILGTVSLVLPYTLFFKAQNYISAQAASIVALFEPVCGVALGFVIYGEHLSLLGAIGAAAVMASICLSTCRP
ncbi:MAG: EamA family transporter [Desulfosalsimonadaceae bacterium]